MSSILNFINKIFRFFLLINRKKRPNDVIVNAVNFGIFIASKEVMGEIARVVNVIPIKYIYFI
jgi:hypothetical protein